MKTKPIRLATAGSTVDGREISAADLDQIASSYDPKTYGARTNIEHIRGISGQAPFFAYGDVVSVSVGEVDVNFNGKTEKRKALYGVLDLTDNAKALVEAKQKVYPSIEIIPNFAGKGFSYLGGVALTDSPASIATDRITFNRVAPGNLSLASGDGLTLEFADDAAADSAKGLLDSMKIMFDKFSASFAAPKGDGQPGHQPGGQGDGQPGAQPCQCDGRADFSALRPLLEELGRTFSASIDALRTEVRAEADAQAIKLKKLEEAQEINPATSYTRRPLADGGAGKTLRTDC